MPRWLKQIFSYVVSIVLYAWIFNWKTSLIILGSIALHELGHLYAAKKLGMKTEGFWLAPFLGGASIIQGPYRKYSHMAIVVLAGPIVGAILTLVCYAGYLFTGAAWLGQAALLNAIFNLFNLAPCFMSDGGQLVEAILFSFNELAGFIFLAVSYVVSAIALWFFNPILAGAVIIFGFPKMAASWANFILIRKGLGHTIRRPVSMTKTQIFRATGYYLMTAAILCGMMSLCHAHGLRVMQLLSR